MKTFDIIGFPINLGCDKNGNELTPELLRKNGCYTSLFNIVNDLGDIGCIDRADIIEDIYSGHPKIKFLNPILNTSKLLVDKVISSVRRGHIPLCVGGDHVMALGSITGISLEKGSDNYAVIYIDAHGDFNTEETSTSGNMHGMHLSYLMGIGESIISGFFEKNPLLNPKNIYFLGTRALDKGEKLLVDKLGLNITTSKELNRSIPTMVVDDVITDIKRKGINHIHLSFDVDVIDPKYAPGTGVPEDNGISPAIALELVANFMKSCLVASVDLVEFNSLLDEGGKTRRIFEQVLQTILDI